MEPPRAGWRLRWPAPPTDLVIPLRDTQPPGLGPRWPALASSRHWTSGRLAARDGHGFFPPWNKHRFFLSRSDPWSRGQFLFSVPRDSATITTRHPGS